MRWRSSRPGRPACQIVCMRPRPQSGQRSSTTTAADASAADEADGAVGPEETPREIKAASTPIPSRDDDAGFGSTRDDPGAAPSCDGA